MSMSKSKEKRGFLAVVVIASWLLVLTPVVFGGPIEESVQLTQEWVKAFHEGNAEAVSATYARDGVYISWAGPFPYAGREAIRATYAGFFRAFPTRFIVLRDESRRVYGDTVIYNSNWSLVYVDAKGTMKTVYGRSSAVSTVVEGRRLIVNHDTSLLPILGP
jgi:uncharacterized protein (TIGR02246 family)